MRYVCMFLGIGLMLVSLGNQLLMTWRSHDRCVSYGGDFMVVGLFLAVLGLLLPRKARE